MANSFLATPIEYLKGVGPERAKLLQKELKIKTYGDLLFHFPFRYVDRSNFQKIKDLLPDQSGVQLLGKLVSVSETGFKQSKRLVAVLRDETGSIELVFFKGIQWLKPKLIIGKEFIVFGKTTRFGARLNITHPEIESAVRLRERTQVAWEPVYSSTEKLNVKGLHSRGIAKLQKVLVPLIRGKIAESLSPAIVQQYGLVGREEALYQLHLPSNPEALKRARKRLIFEELFFVQLMLLRTKVINAKKLNGIRFPEIGNYFNTFYKEHLPFELTGAQKRVLREIRKDVGSGKQMNRLLQGDVGSGKTLVGLLAMLIGLDNNCQTAMMAPTEILANQHYQTMVELLEPIGIVVGLLTGSVKTAARRKLHEKLRSGEMHILIGTHALLEDEVQFQNLGMVIIDEQHRFGVAQRSKLWQKNDKLPHILVMTATPIPRTLAMTLYGDLDVSVIDEMPPGRKPVKTMHLTDANRLKVFQFMEDQIADGRQIYAVYPLIQESASMDYKDLMDGYESISRRFPLPEYKVSIVHGQMKAADKEYEMNLFATGKTQIMVATTVIEVGVNVPNASVMVIESSERFGLSQLHQLRGRVGRGSDQSYCILMTGDKMSNDSKQRIKTMVATTDGFKIAEADLKLRGPGDITGTQQSGILDFKLADIVQDGDVLQIARDAALNVLENDPDLGLPEHKAISQYYAAMLRKRPNWSRIS